MDQEKTRVKDSSCCMEREELWGWIQRICAAFASGHTNTGEKLSLYDSPRPWADIQGAGKGGWK